MPQVLVMALCRWRWTESRKARAKASTKAKAVVLLAVNGPMDGCLDVDEAEDAPTKAKEKENRKESSKERKVVPEEEEMPRARKDVAKCPMGSVRTVTSMDIGQKIVQTWSTRWRDRTQFLLVQDSRQQ